MQYFFATFSSKSHTRSDNSPYYPDFIYAFHKFNTQLDTFDTIVFIELIQESWEIKIVEL